MLYGNFSFPETQSLARTKVIFGTCSSYGHHPADIHVLRAAIFLVELNVRLLLVLRHDVFTRSAIFMPQNEVLSWVTAITVPFSVIRHRIPCRIEV